jgi:polysaccharide export outer membrane protein
VNSSTAHRIPLLAALIAASALPARAQPQPQLSPLSARSFELESSLSPSDLPGAEWTRWTRGRYRITPGDVLELRFPFVPELNQTVTVQPDGYITLKETRDVRVQGLTLADVKGAVLTAYESFVRDPVCTIALTEFEKPYFVASGEVVKPGRYELRGATTITQALALAGGPTSGGNVSQVILFRRYGDEGVEAKQINIRRMYAKKDLSEDPLLRPGDMILVPKGIIGKLAPVLNFWRWRY